MADYRTRAASTADVETIALKELRHRVTRLRRRVFLPTAMGALVLGHAAIAAHVIGDWSIFGHMRDGSYMVSVMTIAIAFLLPAIPIAAAGALAYRVLAARLRGAWCDEFAGRHGISREVLERNAGRYG